MARRSMIGLEDLHREAGMEPERIIRLEVTELTREDGYLDRRVQVHLECGYWYDLGVPIKESVPDLVGMPSGFSHAHGLRPSPEKRTPEKKPHKQYRRMKAKK